MLLYAYFINKSPVKLWGLTSRQRNMRILKSAGVTNFVEDISTMPENSSALLLRGDYLFDERVIRYLSAYSAEAQSIDSRLRKA